MPSEKVIEVHVCTGCCCWDTSSQRTIRSFVGKYGKKLGDIFTGDCSFTVAGKEVQVREHGCFGACIKAPLLKVGTQTVEKYESIADIEAAIRET